MRARARDTASSRKVIQKRITNVIHAKGVKCVMSPYRISDRIERDARFHTAGRREVKKLSSDVNRRRATSAASSLILRGTQEQKEDPAIIHT